MYDNIGSKIKGLAKAIFVFETICAVITGIALCSSNEEELIFIGLLIVIPLGPLVAWVSSWLLYGFGELIDNTCEIARNTRKHGGKSKAQLDADYERISKIEELRSQGLISEEEYQNAISKNT